MPERTDYLVEPKQKKKTETASPPRGCLVAPYRDRGIMYDTDVGTLAWWTLPSRDKETLKTTGGLYVPGLTRM